MTKKKITYDLKSPETQRLIDEIVHGSFLREGAMVAFPLCFPGVSIPIIADESFITALDILPEGIVYGGTSGRRVHVFVAMFHGVTGIVFDMLRLDGFEHCAAVCCGKKQVAVMVNGKTSGRIFKSTFQPLPFDCIQEWGFERVPVDEGVEICNGEKIVHAITDPSKEMVIGITEKHIFTYRFSSGDVQVRGEIFGKGRIILSPSGDCVFGLDDHNALWAFDVKKETIERNKLSLPDGRWYDSPMVWARDTNNGIVYTVDNDGVLYAITSTMGWSQPLGKTHYAPVSTMVVTFDGRLFGTCGEGMADLFCFHPSSKQMTRIGLAISTIQQRRYGYCFGDAVVGRDGQIYFGENDNLGHLWIYFPRINSMHSPNTLLM